MTKPPEEPKDRKANREDPKSDSEYGRFERTLKKVLSAPKKRVDEALERERREREAKRT